MKDLEELKNIIQQEENFEDEAENEDGEEYTRYDITSYGIDFDVDGLVKRLKRGDIFIPEFQRDYVWKMPEASKFVESLLLGLPVPGIFLAQEQETGRMLVIDGQQRLLSLKYFFHGEFKPTEGARTKRVFRLSKVKSQFNGKTYEELDSKDRINLENSVIHATIVKQESPAEDDTSIYHIFERLNSGGRKLTPQEIRVAVYHGKLIELVKELNDLQEWRTIFGQKNDRMKDVELILRFLAMKESYKSYAKPIIEFINTFCAKNRNPSDEKCAYFKSIFSQTIKLFHDSIDDQLFRPARALNVALFEACMVGLAERLTSGAAIDKDETSRCYMALVGNSEFSELISQSTSDVKNLKRRMEIAIAHFAGN
jgi:uncharacterized protein with ParB-like and HNH nuclease domain